MILAKALPVLMLATTLHGSACGESSTGSTSGGSTTGNTSGSTSGSTAGTTAGSTTGSTAGSTAGSSGVIGVSGIAAWDALSDTERNEVNAFSSLFLHQSVGQDLEDGSEAAGYPFEYYGPNYTGVEAGPNGGIFVDVSPGLSNGDPMAKINVFKTKAIAHKNTLRVAFMKFGYADVSNDISGVTLAQVQDAYATAVTDIKAQGVRVMHVTPPLVYSTADNPPKQSMRAWMISTYPNDVIFDLQDIESQWMGTRCEVGGVWRICQEIRSTTECPSKGQGVDGDGAGHLCEQRALNIAKAMLYAMREAGK